MDELELTVKGISRVFYVASHFYDRLQQRCPEVDLPRSLLNSIYIEKRWNNLSALLKYGGLRAFYLWDKFDSLVYVIEENRDTKRMNILKTVYGASECNWLFRWESQNAKAIRKKFRDVFHDDQVFR